MKKVTLKLGARALAAGATAGDVSKLWRTMSQRADVMRGAFLAEFAEFDRAIKRAGATPDNFNKVIDIDTSEYSEEFRRYFIGGLIDGDGAREAFNNASYWAYGFAGPVY